MTRFYTYRKNALKAKLRGQVLKFTKGKGYWLFGKPKPAPPAPLAELTMFDSVTPTQIPANAKAVAGYVNGLWPTWDTVCRLFPHAKHLSIAVNAHADAEALDIERGDAINEDAPAWLRRQQKRGVKQPVLYTSVSNAQALVELLRRNGISRSEYRLWTAHYTYKAHRCSSVCGFGFTAGADATQYSDHALGKNLDASLCSPTFFA